MPDLTIIAGCNGSGKSSTGHTFLPDRVQPFDYDKRFLEIYRAMSDNELREAIAKNQTTCEFEEAVNQAIEHGLDFCYETNFDEHPIYWAEKFSDAGYSLNLIFFCLESQELAQERVQIRTENKGHFVTDSVIDYKWKAGYKNANLHYHFFDNILVVDNSTTNQIYTNLLQVEGKEITLMVRNLPSWFERRFPGIVKMLDQD
ncbi:MAG: putative ABC-type ATPase [Granulosicoccus sp.]|jgi:predicted ABC-type ATPase